MRALFNCSFALALCSITLISERAWADVAPADLCQDEGTTCDNAGLRGDMPGICTPSKCSHPEPKPDGGVIYTDCLRCVPSGAGAGGMGQAGAGAAGAAGGIGQAGAGAAGAAGATDDDSGCNCRLSSAGTERAVAATLLLVGLGALRASRRRR